MALAAVVAGQQISHNDIDQIINLLTGAMTDQQVTHTHATAPPLIVNRSDAAAIKALLVAQQAGVTKYGIGLDASSQFALLDSTGAFVNLGVTDAGAVTTRAGLTVTAGGLVVSAGGASFTGTVTLSSALVQQIGTASADVTSTMSGTAGFFRRIFFQSAGVNRWLLGTNAVAESGSNVGTDFQLEARADAGTSLGMAFTVNRASRLLAVQVGLQVQGDVGSGLAGSLTLTNGVGVGNGVNTNMQSPIKGTGGGPTSAVLVTDWIKVYDGTTTRWIPAFT